MRAAAIIAVIFLALGSQAQVRQDGATLSVDNCTVVSLEREGLIVASRVPGVGFIDALSVEEGDQVTEGQPIGGINDELTQAEKAIQQKKVENDVNIRYAKAQYEVAAMAETKMKAANDLVPTTFPELEIVQARLEKTRAELQEEQARHTQQLDALELGRVDLLLDHHAIRSPVTGIVYEIIRHPGEPVRQGDPILKVYRTDRFRVEGRIPAKDYPRIRKGQPVEVSIVPADADVQDARAQGEVYHGRVVAALPRVLAGREIMVIADVRNHDGGLLDGLRARMTIHLTAPSRGLTRTGRSQ